jgi:hypothetical protein
VFYAPLPAHVPCYTGGMRYSYLFVALALSSACGGSGDGITTSTPPAALAPQAAFGVSPDGRAIAGVTALRLTVSAPASDARYAWDFGDGQTAAGADVTKTYAAPGRYRVTLTVTDARGATSATTREVEAFGLTGYWTDHDAGLGPYGVDIVQQGAVLSGHIETYRHGCHGADIKGTVSGRALTYVGEDECTHFDSFEGTLDESLTTITGKLWFRESDGVARWFDLKLKRQP